MGIEHPPGAGCRGPSWRAQGTHSRKNKKGWAPHQQGQGAGGQEKAQGTHVITGAGGHKEGWTQGFILVHYKGQGPRVREGPGLLVLQETSSEGGGS